MSPGWILVAFLSGTPNISSPESGFAGDPVATWAHEAPDLYLSISLDTDGRCEIVARSNPAAPRSRVLCTYWIHGSRVSFRVPDESPERRHLPTEVEYIPQLDALVIGGDERRALKRQPRIRIE